MQSQNFRFDRQVGSFVGMSLKVTLLTVVTLGVAYPWAMCMKQRWVAAHTYVNGRRLQFTGTGGELFALWIKWWLLMIITSGIYSLWVGPNLLQWSTERTDFDLNYNAFQTAQVNSNPQVAAGPADVSA